MNSSIHLAILSLTLIAYFIALSIQSLQSKALVSQDEPSLLSSSRSNHTNTINNSMDKKRSMVGGYSTVDDPTQALELFPIAEYALGEFAAMQSASSSSDGGESSSSSSVLFTVLPSQVESKEISPIILQAQRQVVAGMNYKLTIGLMRGDVCLGGFKVTVWKQLSGELKATNWGAVIACIEMEKEFGDVLNAMRVKGEMMRDAVEPEK
jgi:hypothetical protein